jgi:ribonucleoside-triphosphate reductase
MVQEFFVNHIENVKKRGGQIVAFDSNNIRNAILDAFKSTKELGEDLNEKHAKGCVTKLVNKILSILHDVSEGPIVSVEQIQDVVEDVILQSTFKKTAKEYILYRDLRNRTRDIIDQSNVNMINDYVDLLDWQVFENSNMGYSLQGLNNYISGEVSKAYWLNKIYPEKVKKSHKSGDLHVHDISSICSYCFGWDLEDLLLQGFSGVSTKIECSPPKHFRTALGQLVNFFYTLQGEAAGAQAFSNFDTLLAPFVYYDKLSYSEVKQGIQEFLFNMNVPTRSGFQATFSNLTFDLIIPKHFKDNPVIIGGEYKDRTYGEFQKESDLINKAFFECMLVGDSNGKVFTFPIPTYNITKDFNWDNKELEGLWKMAAKYGIPYFANFINSTMSPEDTRSLCCRLRLSVKDIKKGGMFGANPLTGSVGVVTINLPRIGYLSKTEEEFKLRLSDLLDIAKVSLEIKRKVVEEFTNKGLYPYSKFYLRKVKERTGKYWTNHFSTIGLVGMNEACLNFLNKDIGTKEGKAFAERVLDFMLERLEAFQKETGSLYNLEATPAEGTSYRLAKLDKKAYPELLCANEGEVKNGAEPFYTNSTHLPVNYTDDIVSLLDHQDSLQNKYTGGTVVHVFLGEGNADVGAVKSFVKRTCESYKLPYFTLSPTFSVCSSHGYINGEQYTCPTCGSATEVFSRIVGYLRPVSGWNVGKKEEFKLRHTFNIEKNKK